MDILLLAETDSSGDLGMPWPEASIQTTMLQRCVQIVPVCLVSVSGLSCRNVWFVHSWVLCTHLVLSTAKSSLVRAAPNEHIWCMHVICKLMNIGKLTEVLIFQSEVLLPSFANG